MGVYVNGDHYDVAFSMMCDGNKELFLKLVKEYKREVLQYYPDEKFDLEEAISQELRDMDYGDKDCPISGTDELFEAFMSVVLHKIADDFGLPAEAYDGMWVTNDNLSIRISDASITMEMQEADATRLSRYCLLSFMDIEFPEPDDNDPR